MSEYYDREGNPIDLMELGEKMQDFDYKVIKQEFAGRKRYWLFGEPKYWISTVWLGLNHNFGEGDPLIFETMVFDNKWKWTKKNDIFPQPFKYREEVDMDRYSTLSAAEAGHEKLVKKYNGFNKSTN